MNYLLFMAQHRAEPNPLMTFMPLLPISNILFFMIRPQIKGRRSL